MSESGIGILPMMLVGPSARMPMPRPAADYRKPQNANSAALAACAKFKAAELRDTGRFSGKAGPESRCVLALARVCLSVDSSK